MSAEDNPPLRLPAGRELLQAFGASPPGLDDYQHTVTIGAGQPDPELPDMRGAHLIIKHPSGRTWPQPWSKEQAGWMLAMGGTVTLAFERYADASAAFARLLREQDRVAPPALVAQPRAPDLSPPIYPLTKAGGTRLHGGIAWPGLLRSRFALVITPEPPLAGMEEGPEGETIYRPENCLAVVLPAGQSWPDPRAEEMAGVTLAAGGFVILLFVGLADALGCQERLHRAVTA